MMEEKKSNCVSQNLALHSWCVSVFTVHLDDVVLDNINHHSVTLSVSFPPVCINDGQYTDVYVFEHFVDGQFSLQL